MSLTSYRAAPPRVGCCLGPGFRRGGVRPGLDPGLSPVMSLASPDLIRGSRAAPPRVICVWAPAGPGPGPGLPRTRSIPRGRGIVGPGSLRASGDALEEPGGDLLFHVLRRSTIGAEGFHGRVRDGIGWFTPRHGHQVFGRQRSVSVVGTDPDPADLRSELCVSRRNSCSAVGEGLPPRGPRLEFIPDLIRGRGTHSASELPSLGNSGLVVLAAGCGRGSLSSD